MKERFDVRSGLIILPVSVEGPTGVGWLRLALDTGATYSLIRPALLEVLGYDPALAKERVRITTGSGVEFAVRLHVTRISALGRSHKDFPVLGHTLPPSAAVDGLLGLDFFRDACLEIDFRAGLIQLDA